MAENFAVQLAKHRAAGGKEARRFCILERSPRRRAKGFGLFAIPGNERGRRERGHEAGEKDGMGEFERAREVLRERRRPAKHRPRRIDDQCLGKTYPVAERRVMTKHAGQELRGHAHGSHEDQDTSYRSNGETHDEPRFKPPGSAPGDGVITAGETV